MVKGTTWRMKRRCAISTVNRRVILRYADNAGRASDAANPNGSAQNIAGICNAGRNVFRVDASS